MKFVFLKQICIKTNLTIVYWWNELWLLSMERFEPQFSFWYFSFFFIWNLSATAQSFCVNIKQFLKMPRAYLLVGLFHYDAPLNWKEKKMLFFFSWIRSFNHIWLIWFARFSIRKQQQQLGDLCRSIQPNCLKMASEQRSFHVI